MDEPLSQHHGKASRMPTRRARNWTPTRAALIAAFDELSKRIRIYGYDHGWRHAATEEQVRICLARVDIELQFYGYELEGNLSKNGDGK